MGKKQARFLLLVLCLAGLIPAVGIAASPGNGGAAAAPAPASALQGYLRQGIDKAFNLEPAAATALFQKAVELDRDNPLGYAFMALGHLFDYEMSFDLQKRIRDQEMMLMDVGEALARGQARIERNPRDGQAYFAMAIAKIVKIRWAIAQKRYFIVAQETTYTWDYLLRARAEDPQNFDIYFPIGLLHYHLDHLPGAARFFSSMLITTGDNQKGLQELALAAQKGVLLRELALAELSSAYTYYEGLPSLALAFTLELKEKYPNNYNFSLSLANILAEIGRFDEAFAIAREIEKGIASGRPPFVPQLQPRYDHLMGRILFNQRDYDRAVEFFEKALKDTSIYNARIRTSALVRLGMIQDAHGNRKQAQEYYNRALVVDGGEGFGQGEAKRYLKTPYVPRPKDMGP